MLGYASPTRQRCGQHWKWIWIVRKLSQLICCAAAVHYSLSVLVLRSIFNIVAKHNAPHIRIQCMCVCVRCMSSINILLPNRLHITLYIHYIRYCTIHWWLKVYKKNNDDDNEEEEAEDAAPQHIAYIPLIQMPCASKIPLQILVHHPSSLIRTDGSVQSRQATAHGPQGPMPVHAVQTKQFLLHANVNKLFVSIVHKW